MATEIPSLTQLLEVFMVPNAFHRQSVVDLHLHNAADDFVPLIFEARVQFSCVINNRLSQR